MLQHATPIGNGYFREVYSYKGMIYKVNQDDDRDANSVEFDVYNYFHSMEAGHLLAPIDLYTPEGMIIMPYIRDLSKYEEYIHTEVLVEARLVFTLAAYDAARADNWGIFDGQLVLRDYAIPALIDCVEFESHRRIDLDELIEIVTHVRESFMLNFGEGEL